MQEVAMKFPDDIEKLQQKVKKILDPIASAVENGTKAERTFYLLPLEQTLGDLCLLTI